MKCNFSVTVFVLSLHHRTCLLCMPFVGRSIIILKHTVQVSINCLEEFHPAVVNLFIFFAEDSIKNVCFALCYHLLRT